MGNIASSYSDKVIITNDNPRNEDDDSIIFDIVSGIKKDNFEIVKSRKDAIIKGISYLGKNDILLILGKGHEDYQIIGNTRNHFSDLEVVREIINGR